MLGYCIFIESDMKYCDMIALQESELLIDPVSHNWYSGPNSWVTSSSTSSTPWGDSNENTVDCKWATWVSLASILTSISEVSSADHPSGDGVESGVCRSTSLLVYNWDCDLLESSNGAASFLEWETYAFSYHSRVHRTVFKASVQNLPWLNPIRWRMRVHHQRLRRLGLGEGWLWWWHHRCWWHCLRCRGRYRSQWWNHCSWSAWSFCWHP